CAATSPASAIGRKVGRTQRVVAKVEWHPNELYPRGQRDDCRSSRSSIRRCATEKLLEFPRKRCAQDEVRPKANGITSTERNLEIAGHYGSQESRCGFKISGRAKHPAIANIRMKTTS